MLVKIDPQGAKQTKARAYIVRFVFGGAITAIAGMIGDRWGPAIAGLFLAFPAIFPASLTMLESHERERKARKRLRGHARGITAAADYAMGTAVGSFGLMAFAAMCWGCLEHLPAALTMAGGVLLWSGVSGLLWILLKRSH